MLYRGQNNIGTVPSAVKNSQLFVSLEEAGEYFGLSPSRNNDELILSRGNLQLRVSAGAAAGWHGFSIIPLYSAPFIEGGKFWLDAQSAAALFQTIAGRGAGNRLRFAEISGYRVAASNAKEFGQFSEPEMPSAPTLTAKKSSEAQENINSIINGMTERPSQPKPQKVQTVQKVQKPVMTASVQEKWEELTASLEEEKPAPSETVQEEKASEPLIAASSEETEKPRKTRPRLEAFKPDDEKTEKGENYNGTIQGIRWTSQEGTHKKIRAVIMAEEDSDPQVFMSDGNLHALFASSLESSKSIASPFTENVKAELKKSIDGIDLIFTPKGITKAEKLVLNNPRRIVFDFFFPEDTNIIGTSPQTAETAPVKLPGQADEVKQEVKAEAPKFTSPDTVITANPPSEPRKLPAVMTPPSTITIPTSSQAAQRLGRANGRKTIVIDPGHGGKDPGAVDNGVREKDVNLAVGLELMKVLNARGYNAVMTRATDVYLKLQERTDIANNVNADLFVSVHVNALPTRKSMTGFEIYIMALPTDKDAMNLAKLENREYVEGKGMDTENVDRRTEMLLRILGDLQQNNKISESTDFAAALYNAGVRNGLPMRRVAQAPFFVLRGAGMPAVLLEIGFVTNAEESQLLMTQPYQRRIAEAMAEGISNYIR